MQCVLCNTELSLPLPWGPVTFALYIVNSIVFCFTGCNTAQHHCAMQGYHYLSLEGRPSPWEPTQDQLPHSQDWLSILLIISWWGFVSVFTPKSWHIPTIKSIKLVEVQSLTRIKAKACWSLKWFHQPLKLVTAWGRTLTEPTNSDENPVKLPNKWNLGWALLRNAVMDAQQKFWVKAFLLFYFWQFFMIFAEILVWPFWDCTVMILYQKKMNTFLFEL